MARSWLGMVVVGLSVALAASWARGQGVQGVGSTREFPKSAAAGAVVEFQLWHWDADPAARKMLAVLEDGSRVPAESPPRMGMFLRFRVGAAHDAVRCTAVSSDCFDRIAWGPEKVDRTGSAERMYRAYPESFPYPTQVGRYCLEVEATDAGKSVARRVIRFEIVAARAAPQGTHYMEGRKDCQGNAITCSTPVTLTALNETPVLKDNDYPFEPQHAYNVVNFERFPPFRLPARFLAVYNSRRFTDEDKFGGPLDRGFSAQASIDCKQDNLPIAQRVWFHTPDLQVMIIHKWLAADPTKYADLKPYADHRSAFVSAESAYKLGWACYEAWGAGGYGPYDPGIYGWDEEQMWPTIAAKLLKEHPELLPAELRALKDKDPKVEGPGTLAVLQDAYTKAWGEFVGHGYRGARACAAARGRAFRIWHYGSKAPGERLFVGPDDGKPDPATGKYKYEELGDLWPWFKDGDRVDYNASEYSRQIDYFHKDFYYHTLFAEKSSMYEKDQAGQYVLDDKGRRKIRTDVFEESVYVTPTKVGHEDCRTGPAFLKAFLAKGENALFWLNGGKYPKRRGQAITAKQMIPALRPGNQETWGESAKLGSRPVNPYLAESAVIYTFMMGLEGLYYWDAPGSAYPAGLGRPGDKKSTDTLGDIELAVKGLHRVSNFSALFEGEYAYVRPVRHYDTWNRDHPIIRGILNGRYLVLAMTNPYLNPGESQAVELWYGAPYADKAKVWSGQVTLLSRKNHLFQCKLPDPPAGTAYDPDKLYFRYTCQDGKFQKTFTVTGNYDVAYPGAGE